MTHNSQFAIGRRSFMQALLILAGESSLGRTAAQAAAEIPGARPAIPPLAVSQAKFAFDFIRILSDKDSAPILSCRRQARAPHSHSFGSVPTKTSEARSIRC